MGQGAISMIYKVFSAEDQIKLRTIQFQLEKDFAQALNTKEVKLRAESLLLLLLNKFAKDIMAANLINDSKTPQKIIDTMKARSESKGDEVYDDCLIDTTALFTLGYRLNPSTSKLNLDLDFMRRVRPFIIKYVDNKALASFYYSHLLLDCIRD